MIATGPGRGIAFMYLVFPLAMLAVALGGLRVLRNFDDDVPDAVADDLIGLQTLTTNSDPEKADRDELSSTR